MRRILAFAIVFATAVLVRSGRAHDPTEPRTVALAAGFALVAAALVGDVAERVRLPRVSGYLLFGIVTGPYVADIISRSMARDLQLIDGIAVALIAVMAGLEMNFRRLGRRLAVMMRLGGTLVGLLYVSVFVLLFVAWPAVPIEPSATGPLKLALVGLTTTVVTSFSPTVTIAVIAEERAAGPLSDLTLALVVLGDLLLVFGFGLAMQFVRTAAGGTAEVGLFANLSWDIVGSLAFGAIVGSGLALYIRGVGREIALVFVAACAILSEIGTHMRFEPVLAGLAAGLVVENLGAAPGDRTRRAVEQSALPILIVFFAAAGASVQFDALRTIGVTAAAFVAARALLIWAGASLAVRSTDIPAPVGGLLWRGLVSQAGLTLGLAVIVGAEFPGWGTRLQVLLVAMIALNEMVGPVLFRAALARAGEIDTGSTA